LLTDDVRWQDYSWDLRYIESPGGQSRGLGLGMVELEDRGNWPVTGSSILHAVVLNGTKESRTARLSQSLVRPTSLQAMVDFPLLLLPLY